MPDQRILLCTLLGLAIACEGGGVVNPTGHCEKEDIDRGSYDGLAGPTWVPDCENPLTREYFRVRHHEDDETVAFILPRLDGSPLLAEPCGDQEHDLHGLVTKYPLCESARGEADVEAVNSMELEDALILTHYLHTVLSFETVPYDHLGDEVAIEPYAIPIDVQDACALHETSGGLLEACEAVAGAEAAEVGLGPLDPEGGAALAERLNELYGIE